jgi:hypothetical protein
MLYIGCVATISSVERVSVQSSTTPNSVGGFVPIGRPTKNKNETSTTLSELVRIFA